MRGLALSLAGSADPPAAEAVSRMLDHAEDAQLVSTAAFDGDQLERALRRQGRLTSELATVLELLRIDGRPSAGYVALLACHLARVPVLPTHPDVRLPVLFDIATGPGRSPRQPGAVGRLTLGSLADGPPGLHPDPRRMAFFYSPTSAFAASLSHAWDSSPLARTDWGVCWALTLDLDAEGPANTVHGGSLGGAYAVGLTEVHRRRARRLHLPALIRGRGPALDFRPRVLNPRAAVSATVTDGAGTLGPVTGLDHKLAAATRDRLEMVIAHPRTLHTAPADIGVAVAPAASVPDAIRRARTATNRRFLRTVVGLTLLTVCLTLVVVVVGLALAADRRHRHRVAAEGLLRELMLVRDSDPRLALQLGAAAVALDPSPAARAGLTETLAWTPLAGVGVAPGGVTALAADRTGGVLWGGTENGRLIRWRLDADGRMAPTGDAAAPSFVRALVVAADGRTVYAEDTANCLTVWDGGAPGEPARLAWRDPSPTSRCGTGGAGPAPGQGQDLALNRTGRVLAAASSDGTVSLLDVAEPIRPRLLSRTLLPGSGVWSVAFAPHDDALVTGEADGTVTAWDVADPVHPRRLGAVRKAHTDIVRGLAFDPGGRRLVSGGLDNAVQVWDTTDLGRLRSVATLRGHGGDVFRVAWSADGRDVVSVGADRRAIVWDADRLQPRARLRGQDGYLRALAALPGGRVVTGSLDGTALMWEPHAPGGPVRRPPVLREGGKVRALAFGPDGVELALGTSTGAVRVLDTAHPGAAAVTVPRAAGPVYALVYAPDGTLIDGGSGPAQVRAWDVHAPGGPAARWSRSPTHGAVYALALDPSGTWLATGGADGTIVEWRLGPRGAEPAAEAQASDDPVTALHFRPQGSSLAAGGLDRTATVYSLTHPGPLRPVGRIRDHDEAVYAVRYSPSGDLLALSSADGSSSLWSTVDPAAPVRVAKLVREDHTRRLRAQTFSPDGGLLVTGGDEGTVWVYDLADPTSPRLIAAIPIVDPAPEADADGVLALAYARHTLAVGTGTGEVQLHDLTGLETLRQQPRELACARAGSGLDPTAWALHIRDVPYEPTCG